MTDLVELPTRERIMDVAARQFADNGFAGVSMRNIADAVGIQAASLYNYFNDKDALYFASIKYAFSDRLQELEQAMQNKGSPEKRLVVLLTTLARGNIEDTVSTKLLQRELLRGDSTHQKWLSERIFKEPFHHVADLLEEIGPEGEGEQTAIYLSALTMGYAILGPLFEQFGTTAYTSDPLIFGRDIARRLINPDGRMVV